MATSVFILPIIPGKEDFDRETLQHMAAPGADHDGYVAARRSQGITREAIWHQRTPRGTFAIVLMEGDDINAAMGAMITGQDPFNTQFRQFVKGVHGVDLAEGPAPRCDPDRRQHLLEVASRGPASWPAADPGRRPRPSRTRR